MSKQKESMIPGKRYRGYGYVNEFKEFFFEPEETGSREGVIKSICNRDGISLSETKNLILVRMKMPKCTNVMDRLLNLAKMYNIVVNVLKSYEI